MLKNKLTVSPSPHLHSPDDTQGIMLDVILALLPALAMSAIIFGYYTLVITAVSVASCVGFEYAIRKIFKRDNTIWDLSAVVTGILLAFNLPANIPIWMVIIGAFTAIVVVKQFFGGIGQNFVNPALVGRLVLMISFPDHVNSNWVIPFKWREIGWLYPADNMTDAITGATPLASDSIPSLSSMLNGTARYGGDTPSLLDMFFGVRPGSLGETCVAALLFGFAFLLIRRVIAPTIPLIFMGTTAAVCWIGGQNPLYALMSGGLMLGAIYMATDYTTSPITTKGKIIFGIGCGLITALIRLFGNLPEGVSIAIIIMNILTQHIDNLTVPKYFGSTKPSKIRLNGKKEAE